MLARPTPSTRTTSPFRAPLIAPAARKYEADDASPSTWISPGERYGPAGTVKRDHSVRVAATPKRRIRLSVISTYGFDTSSPSTTIVPPPAVGSAMSSAVTYWLDTLPRTRAATGVRLVAGQAARGGQPALPRDASAATGPASPGTGA